ncbi:MAG: Cna B-type domain-containing protein, partial [Ruminococcaceae bacterium]|nr:Cna B-type domain-containing protein [Oscillospiraceae bacterium]
LLQVASGEGSACTYLPAFADLEIGVQELMASPGEEEADRVFQYAYYNGIDGQVKHTSAQGAVEFRGLDKGVYLVFERGEQAVAFQPYLVILPSEINGQMANNVISVPKTSENDVKTLVVEKIWDDEMNKAGMRPGYVTVEVFRDGIPVRSVTLSDANDWLHVFTMLPLTGTYTVAEKEVRDYRAEYVPVPEGYLIFNTYTGTPGGGTDPEPPEPEKAHVVVRKVWDDDNDAEGKRPDRITVQLVEGGTVIKTAGLSEANRWEHTFADLDPAKRYTVKEIAVTDYTATYTGDAASGITITNTYTGETSPGEPPPPIIPEPDLITIPVTVKWVDENNAAGKRPDEVTVHLLAGGSVMRSIQVRPDGQSPAASPMPAAYTGAEAGGNAAVQFLSFRMAAAVALAQETAAPDNRWEGAFRDVPGDLSYTVWQTPVEDYTTTYEGNAAEGFVITNTYTAGTTDPGLPPDPTVPEDPVDPVDPVNPVDPPVDPVDPPVDPFDPPVDPVDPPVDPVDPPVDPVVPTIPQTGVEVLPIYLLMAAGVLLVLLGIVDLYRGRKEV